MNKNINDLLISNNYEAYKNYHFYQYYIDAIFDKIEENNPSIKVDLDKPEDIDPLLIDKELVNIIGEDLKELNIFYINMCLYSSSFAEKAFKNEKLYEILLDRLNKVDFIFFDKGTIKKLFETTYDIQDNQEPYKMAYGRMVRKKSNNILSDKEKNEVLQQAYHYIENSYLQEGVLAETFPENNMSSLVSNMRTQQNSITDVIYDKLVELSYSEAYNTLDTYKYNELSLLSFYNCEGKEGYTSISEDKYLSMKLHSTPSNKLRIKLNVVSHLNEIEKESSIHNSKFIDIPSYDNLIAQIEEMKKKNRNELPINLFSLKVSFPVIKQVNRFDNKGRPTKEELEYYDILILSETLEDLETQLKQQISTNPMLKQIINGDTMSLQEFKDSKNITIKKTEKSINTQTI